jgi:hypothetical protein
VIPAKALEEWLALDRALAGLEAATPCQAWPEAWDSDVASAQERATAVQECRSCPVLGPCGAYARAARESTGVWGGRNRGRGSRDDQEEWLAQVLAGASAHDQHDDEHDHHDRRSTT